MSPRDTAAVHDAPDHGMVWCGPYTCSLTERACAERHALSHAARGRFGAKRAGDSLTRCRTCVEGRDRMQAHGLVPVERLCGGLRISSRGEREHVARGAETWGSP